MACFSIGQCETVLSSTTHHCRPTACEGGLNSALESGLTDRKRDLIFRPTSGRKTGARNRKSALEVQRGIPWTATSWSSTPKGILVRALPVTGGPLCSRSMLATGVPTASRADSRELQPHASTVGNEDIGVGPSPSAVPRIYASVPALSALVPQIGVYVGRLAIRLQGGAGFLRRTQWTSYPRASEAKPRTNWRRRANETPRPIILIVSPRSRNVTCRSVAS